MDSVGEACSQRVGDAIVTERTPAGGSRGKGPVLRDNIERRLPHDECRRSCLVTAGYGACDKILQTRSSTDGNHLKAMTDTRSVTHPGVLPKADSGPMTGTERDMTEFCKQGSEGDVAICSVK